VGLSVDLHPLQLLREALEEQGAVRLSALGTLAPGASVRIAGVVTARQRPATSNGVVFLTLEDETGLANLVVWPAVWQEHHKLGRSATILGADGRLQRQGDALSVLVERFWEVPPPDERPAELPLRSRDFR
jgi:error-prone DNA polymerase